jgi:hypothetical protein
MVGVCILSIDGTLARKPVRFWHKLPKAAFCQTKTTGYARGSKEAEADDEKQLLLT